MFRVVYMDRFQLVAVVFGYQQAGWVNTEFLNTLDVDAVFNFSFQLICPP